MHVEVGIVIILTDLEKMVGETEITAMSELGITDTIGPDQGTAELLMQLVRQTEAKILAL